MPAKSKFELRSKGFKTSNCLAAGRSGQGQPRRKVLRRYRRAALAAVFSICYIQIPQHAVEEFSVLPTMKRNQYKFPASIEYEYNTPEGSDVVTEVKKCVEYWGQVLG